MSHNRRKLVAGNWKMFGTRASLGEVRAIADAAAAHSTVDVALCVPFTLIAAAAEAAPALAIGAQDVHENADGAHTGCISTAMLVVVFLVALVYVRSVRTEQRA